MRKPLAFMGVLAATFAAVFAVAPSANAAPSAIKFTTIQYSPPGSDTADKLNQEWVKLKNTSSSRTINIGGWKLHDTGQDHEYFFPSTRLSPRETVKVHTGTGSSSPGHRYWNLDNYVWNNDGDKATLRKSGVIKDRCGWSSDTDGLISC
jgi:hypothetical protein